MFTWGYIAQNYHPLIEKNGVWYHEVSIKEGMTLFSISQDLAVSSTQIKADNSGLTDQVLLGSKVLVRAVRSTFDYLVIKGDTPFGISKKFAISIDTLAKYNPSIVDGLQFRSLVINQKLKIHLGIKRYALPEDIINPAPEFTAVDSNSMNFRTFDFTDTIIYYVVKSGDKLSDLSKRYLISATRLKSLNALEDRLDEHVFFRANRKHIINLHWIEKIEPYFNGGLLVELKGGEKIEISRRQTVKFKEMMSF